MTKIRSEGELLRELRTQLQETQAADFEMSRAPMIALVDQLHTLSFDRHFGTGNGTTLRSVENAFIEAMDQMIRDEPIQLDSSMTKKEKDQIFAQLRQEQAKEQERRLDDLEKEVSPLHAGAVLHLFSRLEYAAGSVIRPLLALIRTVDPVRIKEQCPWLPKALVHETDRALKADKIKGGSWKVLNPEEQASFRQECLEWLDRKVRKRGDCDAFDAQMAQKYPRASRDTIERYRLELQREKSRTASIEGDRD